MELFSPAGHEQVVIAQDPSSGLRAIIALHSTVLGPGLGGTRFYPYAGVGEALGDVLRLSRAMTYKNAVAGLSAGGGKAVILGDPGRDKTPELLRAYGTAVARLGGRYVTACDVGTYVADMDVIAGTNPWTTGRSRDRGGAGDSGELTAIGVYAGMRAGARHVWGSPDLGGRTVAISGLGKVGGRLAVALAADGATVIGADVDPAAVRAVRERVPAMQVVSVEEISRVRADVFSPNALGGALSAESVGELSAVLVCGGANNQLATPEVADDLLRRGITWCPDYVVNAGGVIAVADEGLNGPYDHERASRRAEGIGETTTAVLDAAARAGVSPGQAADARAEARLQAAGQQVTLPGAAADRAR